MNRILSRTAVKLAASAAVCLMLFAPSAAGAGQASAEEEWTRLLHEKHIEASVVSADRSFDGQTLTLALEAQPDPMMQIRTKRALLNELRYKSLQAGEETENLELVFIRSGEEFYSETQNDLTRKRAFFKPADPAADLEASRNRLNALLALQAGISDASSRVLDSRLGGREASIVCRAEPAAVNDLTAELARRIGELNDTDRAAIARFDLTVLPAGSGGSDPLLYLSADLVYADYYWWQSPELGGETWTGSGPRLPQ
ncbi:hypothetical protein QWJ34_23400 [Saccharibacillus sp. CPCC 101409]|uniref:hypothetical protein n=1 Tax=Saccharibacillus sp. CPCC 101409 TaxID=3058041 RepID=UPI002671DD6D|nr:hypothetical protein [Saccharibacillus sp. CPCC 101409]MDO3412733.1 hypothetical protein [Saccharibacillus sp. CPCC 101409]